MAKKKKEEVVEKTPEKPTVDETVEKLKIKKPKKFEQVDDTIKVDLSKPVEKTDDVIKVDLSKPVEESKTVEEPVEALVMQEIKEEEKQL